MQIEAFSEGKNLDDPEANEDQFLVLPGTGLRRDRRRHRHHAAASYDGMRSGLASRVASCMRAVADFLLDPAEQRTDARNALIERASAALRAVLRPARHPGGCARAIPQNALGRPSRSRSISDPRSGSSSSATAACGINGAEVVVVDTGLDLVTASTARRRPTGWSREAGGGSRRPQRRVEPRLQLSWRRRAASRHAALARRGEARGCSTERSLAWLPRALSRRRPSPISERLLERGISGQTRFQNNTVSPFSYGGARRFRRSAAAGAGVRPAARIVAVDRALHRRLFQAGAQPRTLPPGKRRSPRSSASTPKRSTPIRRSRARSGGCERTTGRS